MSFKVNPAKPFVEELKKVGVVLIDDAIEALSHQPNGPHAAVHQARKKFKRVRALYRFIQKQEPEFRAVENARFRDIARSLSAARDAAALVENISYLEEFSRSDTERTTLAAVHETLARRRDAVTGDDGDLPARIDAAVAECESGKHALLQLSLPHSEKIAMKLIKQTWRKQREKALSALGNCNRQAQDEHFHDLRKSGQIYWIHLALLRTIWPSAMRTKKTDAKRLVDILGHEHDLSVLAAFADREPDIFKDSQTLALLLDAIIHRQQALRQECLDLADHVFAESAKTESEIIGLLWKHAAA